MDERQEIVRWANTADMPVRNQPDRLGESTPGERRALYFKTEQDWPEVITKIHDRIADRFDLHGRVPSRAFGKIVVHDQDSRTPEHIDNEQHLGPGKLKTSVLICEPEEGGEFVYDGRPVYFPEGACIVFTSDRPHEVKMVTVGRRIVLVFGWLEES